MEHGASTLALQSAEQSSNTAGLEEVSELFARVKGLFADYAVHRPHPGIILVHGDNCVVLLAPARLWMGMPRLFEPWREARERETAVVLLVGQIDRQLLTHARQTGLLGLLRRDSDDSELVLNIEHAFECDELKTRHQFRAESLTRYEYEFGELAENPRSLTTERNLERLLGLILEKSRVVTGADAGSLYVVEGATGSPEVRRLHFKLSANDSRKIRLECVCHARGPQQHGRLGGLGTSNNPDRQRVLPFAQRDVWL